MKVVDMHCDTIAELYERRKQGSQETILENQLHLDLQKMRAGDYGLQNFALFTCLEQTEHPFEYAMELADLFFQEMEEHKDQIGIVTSYEEIRKNWEAGRMSALLTLEEGGVCQGNLSFLRDFYRIGVRMMTLTWNYKNELGCPNTIVMDGPDAGFCRPDTEHGLTETGIAFVEEMERIGMIIDISHLNDAGIWDVFRHTKKPFVASHSNARALASHPRNLTDEMIRALAERGGVAGINYCGDFLHDWNGEPAKSTIAHMVAHMKHMKQIGGVGVIGLGSDFDGIGGDLEIRNGGDLPLLEQEMGRQGFTQSEIEAIFYGNVLRVYRELL